MNDQFKKAVNLVRRTRDKIIVFDNINNADSAYVLMNLDEYEKIVLNTGDLKGLSEEELIDKINRDIAIWKSQQEYVHSEDDKEVREELRPSSNTEYSNTEYRDRFLPRTGEDGEAREGPVKKRWTIPPDRKEAAEEVIEEDRQYLEEITF